MLPRLFSKCLAVCTLTFLAAAASPPAGAQPFSFLQPGFTQEVFGHDPGFMGGVAFAPDGDVWVDDCLFSGSGLRRFDLQSLAGTCGTTSVHPQSPGSPFPSNAGCGLTNHPDGFLYSNIDDGTNGVSRLDGSTAAFLLAMGSPGNALGITVDPQTDDLVYVARDCRFTGVCTLFRLDPASASSSIFASLVGFEFIDGIYFDPSGNYLFLSTRSPGFAVTVLDRAGSVVQNIPMASEPDGIAFHSSPPVFVVTVNTDGTMTRFDFPANDFTQPPVQSVFASGGFRGDLSQVGADGCLYLTQAGTRCLDGTVLSDNSVVRICGGFAPPPGVGEVCEPLTQGFWKRQCKGSHPSGEPEKLPGYAACVSSSATFLPVADRTALCDRLHPNPPNSKCEQAEAQFMALLLNRCSGRLSPSCCVLLSESSATTVGEAISEIDALLSNPDRSSADCVRAQSLAASVNEGTALCP